MIVLDSSFLIGYHNGSDVHHEAATAAMEKIARGAWGQVLLPEYVFLEVMTVVMARKNLSSAVMLGEALLHAKEVEFVPGSDFFSDAFLVFQTQKHSTLSFVDAAIVAIARKYDARFVATFDEDFQDIEGLQMIPKKSRA